MTRRFVVAVLLALGSGLVIVGDATPAEAACAGPSDIVEAIADADVVFIGLVQSVSSHDRLATMEVVEIWKGPALPVTVDVHGGDPQAAVVGPDDRTYEAGRAYLVVATNESPPFLDSLCSATMLYRPDGVIPTELWAAVGASEVRYPEEVAAESPAPTGKVVNSPTVRGIAAAALVICVGIVLYRGGERRRTAAKAGAGPRLRINFEGAFSRSGARRLRKLRSQSK